MTPTLVDGPLPGQGGRTLLHVVTDWPGHRPHVAATIALLVEHGAAVDEPFAGEHRETALHWAASSDDVEAVDALLEAGASIDARVPSSAGARRSRTPRPSASGPPHDGSS